jgi:thiol:disulfide interchange protein DsbC
MSRLTLTVLAATLLACTALHAQEDQIRKTLAARIPNLPKIDEVRPGPLPGLYEVRHSGSEIIYTDAKGEYIFEGSILETKTMTNLTEQRQNKLTAVAFSALPVKDAVVFRQGSGSRKMAVFVDPNCGYCKRFERDLATLKDVTIYAFIMPILGPDSIVKARDIWCSGDVAKTWRSWMLDGVAPRRSIGQCDTAALDRNVEFGHKYRIQGTPAVFFEDGTRKPGALPLAEVEKLLSAATKKS